MFFTSAIRGGGGKIKPGPGPGRNGAAKQRR